MITLSDKTWRTVCEKLADDWSMPGNKLHSLIRRAICNRNDHAFDAMVGDTRAGELTDVIAPIDEAISGKNHELFDILWYRARAMPKDVTYLQLKQAIATIPLQSVKDLLDKNPFDIARRMDRIRLDEKHPGKILCVESGYTLSGQEQDAKKAIDEQKYDLATEIMICERYEHPMYYALSDRTVLKNIPKRAKMPLTITCENSTLVMR